MNKLVNWINYPVGASVKSVDNDVSSPKNLQLMMGGVITQSELTDDQDKPF